LVDINRKTTHDAFVVTHSH